MKNSENPVIVFHTAPEQYKHWKLEISGPVARLSIEPGIGQVDITELSGRVVSGASPHKQARAP